MGSWPPGRLRSARRGRSNFGSLGFRRPEGETGTFLKLKINFPLASFSFLGNLWYLCLTLTLAALGPHRPGRVGASVRAEPKTAPNMGRSPPLQCLNRAGAPENSATRRFGGRTGPRGFARRSRFLIRDAVLSFLSFISPSSGAGLVIRALRPRTATPTGDAKIVLGGWAGLPQRSQPRRRIP